MGIFDSLRKSSAGSKIRSDVKNSSLQSIRMGSENALAAFQDLMSAFRTDVQLGAKLDIHASEAREYYILTFYYGAIAYLQTEYRAMRIVHQAGLYALYLMSNAGATQEQALEIAPKIEATAETTLAEVANKGTDAMYYWAAKNDTDTAVKLFKEVCDMADRSGFAV